MATRSAPSYVLLAWALLLSAWVIGNPPFAAPDEAYHYIRAIGVSEGHLLGKADPAARVGVTPRQVAWTAEAARAVSLPRGLDPQPFTCEIGPGGRSGACLNGAAPSLVSVTRVSTVGNYQPFPYLLPAAVIRAGSSAPAALRLGRAAEALTAFVLLAIAVFALYDGTGPLLSLLGLLLAVTPMAIFCGAMLSGSSTEIAGAVAFLACLLRVGRRGSPPARWWAFTALSGAVLALSRSTGPAWLILALLIVAAFSGPRTFVRRWADSWASRTTAGVLVLAIALNRLWEGLYGPRVPLDTSELHAGLVAGAHQWWTALPELVGDFGYLEVKLPLAIPVVWFGLVALLCAAAGAASSTHERRVLAAALVVGLVGPVIFYALFIRPTGFGLQGRYVLPALVAIPLLAGEALYRHRKCVRARWLRLLTVTVPIAVAFMQASAWYVNAKRYAVGRSGPEWFLGRAAWTPPAGWWLWLTVVVLASLCLAATAALGRDTTEPAGATPAG